MQAHGATLAGVIDAPQGNVTIELKVKTAPPSATNNPTVTINLAAFPIKPRMLFGAIVLE